MKLEVGGAVRRSWGNSVVPKICDLSVLRNGKLPENKAQILKIVSQITTN